MDESVEGAGRLRLALLPPPDAGHRTGPAAGESVVRELCQCGAEQGAGKHVAGVVHAGVDARVGDQRGERVQRGGGRRRHVADAGREREGGGGVPRRERARARHPRVPRERDVARQAVGAAPPCERLDGDVGHGRGDGERGEALAAARRPVLPPVSASSAAEVKERRE